MLPLPEEIIAVLSNFALLFSQPVWRHVRVLVIGGLLCRGARTVTAVLRVMGLKDERRFGKYHRVLSRAHWSGLVGARILLGLLVALLPRGWPMLVGIDETIERRKGRKIQAQGVYRDAVRSRRVARGEVPGTEVGKHDAPGALAVELPAVGLAVLDLGGALEGG